MCQPAHTKWFLALKEAEGKATTTLNNNNKRQMLENLFISIYLLKKGWFLNVSSAWHERMSSNMAQMPTWTQGWIDLILVVKHQGHCHLTSHHPVLISTMFGGILLHLARMSTWIRGWTERNISLDRHACKLQTWLVGRGNHKHQV